ncbi:hypothetical protein VNO80_27112 [Phaseolus coccineus]|uniref:Uncharacterized protein n=1 Tax=Phaseolus coccineus TaxID=3886 RepID=A0AAN9LKZ4_PHACN
MAMASTENMLLVGTKCFVFATPHKGEAHLLYWYGSRNDPVRKALSYHPMDRDVLENQGLTHGIPNEGGVDTWGVVLCVMEEKGWSGMISVRCGGEDKILVSAIVGATNPFVTRKLPC